MTAQEIYQKMNGDEKFSVKEYARDEGEICAFQNTFMKSINPEAVEDMRNALQNIIVEFEAALKNHVAMLHVHTGQPLSFDSVLKNSVLVDAKSALEKSKL